MKIITNLEAEQINFLDERFYQLGDKYYPSVTTILDVWPKGHGFNQWLKDLGMNADAVVQRAADSGSKVHDAIHRALEGEELEWDDKTYNLEEWQFILKFQDFWSTYTPELLGSEVTLINEKLGFAGSCDLVIKFNDQIWLIDLKTSNALHSSYELQVAAYRALWNDSKTIAIQNGIVDTLGKLDVEPIDRAGIFWFKSLKKGESKTGNIQGKGWEIKESKRDYKESLKLFKAAHEIWKSENPNAKPYNKILPTRIKL